MKNSLTQDVRFSYSAIEEGAKLSNKLWNAARLIVTACRGRRRRRSGRRRSRSAGSSRGSRRRSARSSASSASSTSRTSTDELYHLTFDDFCDWYLEAVKGRLYDGDADARATATAALERLLKLLHPVMPHVTEEIWSNLPAAADAPDRRAVAARRETRPRRARSTRVQEAAQVFRRSGVVPPLEGDEKRIFDAVVKPERAPQRERQRRRGARAAAARRSRAPRRCSRTTGSSQNAPAEVVDAEREKLERYRALSSMQSAT